MTRPLLAAIGWALALAAAVLIVIKAEGARLRHFGERQVR